MSDASVASEDKSTDYDLLREVYLYLTERKYQTDTEVEEAKTHWLG